MSEHMLGLVAATGISLCLVACTGATGSPAAGQSSPVIHLTGFEKTFDCQEVRGELVVLIKPDLGALVLAADELPGTERVGSIDGTRARFSFPDLRLREQSAHSEVSYAGPQPLWGMAVPEIDPQIRPGCFGMDRPKNIDADELRSLVRRKVAELADSPPR